MKNHKRRPRDDDESTVMTIDFDEHPVTNPSKRNEHVKDLSSARKTQLERAREVALNNRRRKMRTKLEARLQDIRSKLGDLRNDQLEKVVLHLIQLEDHHRSKLSTLTQSLTEQLQNLCMEVQAALAPKIGTLSDVAASTRR